MVPKLTSGLWGSSYTSLSRWVAWLVKYVALLQMGSNEASLYTYLVLWFCCTGKTSFYRIHFTRDVRLYFAGFHPKSANLKTLDSHRSIFQIFAGDGSRWVPRLCVGHRQESNSRPLSVRYSYRCLVILVLEIWSRSKTILPVYMVGYVASQSWLGYIYLF